MKNNTGGLLRTTPERMESTESMEGLCSDRLAPQIGPNHQVTMPPLKQSARIATMEYLTRDQWYACGLAVPVMRSIASISSSPRKCWSSADEDKGFSLASTSNSRIRTLLRQKSEGKDANSCASSSTRETWKKEESFVVESMIEDMPGISGESEPKSSIISAGVGANCIIKKKKKRRSCWQTLKRKGNKKARTEKGRKEKRWSHGEMVDASGQGSERWTILPGSQPDSWTEDEMAAFTLALYLFDKDFCAIKRFLETKKMKDIVHHYYGKFYGTPAFCRWAGSKNNRNRKCVHGPRILQGWRQDELLRRLIPHISENSKDKIPEAVKSFNERELTVEGLVSELKAAVGLEVLVHCVGIGVPKRDFTAVLADPAKHPSSSRLEVLPAGKSCSTLSKEEMLEYLTGDLRISKTRAQDLFWDAVWPRLLGHGWQSTQCEIPGSKNPLVFLRPGVKKIAKECERGVHYFDSVSEVLKAVANDPGLLDSSSELTVDTGEGSDNHDDDDDVQEWSDDMFETLDMHRLRAPRSVKREVRAKVEEKTRDELDSSESSSVDIDLNRPLSVVTSNLPEAAPPRFAIEAIDLNLPPVDLDCNSPGEEDDEMKTCYSSFPFSTSKDYEVPKMVGVSYERGSTSSIVTINLNDPLPAIVEELAAATQLSSAGQEGHIYVPSMIWPKELVALDPLSSCHGIEEIRKATSCNCGVLNSCICQSRKGPLGYQKNNLAVEWVDNGKELVSVPKKRTIRLEIPSSLGGLGTPNFVFTMNANIAAKLRSWPKLGFPPSPWRKDWSITLSHTVLSIGDDGEKSSRVRNLRKSKAVVEVDGDTEAEIRGTDGHVLGSLSTMASGRKQCGSVKRLRCHFSAREAPVPSLCSRTTPQRPPRKFTISVDSRSSKNQLLKAKEQCPDWAWPRNRLSDSENLSSCSTTHGAWSVDFSAPRGFVKESLPKGAVRIEILDDRRQQVKNEDCDLRNPGYHWQNTSGSQRMGDGSTQEMEEVTPNLRHWKAPGTLTSPRDSCDTSELQRQMPRSRGIRSSSRSHSLHLPMKRTPSDFGDLDMGMGIANTQGVENAKRVKVDTSYSLRSREMAEHDLLLTLCSMQDRKVEGRTASSDGTPKVKGKRSSRTRRRNFSFKQFIFEGNIEEVEEGLCVQPCTSQGPWQPNWYLPSNEKIPRSPKLRRRRSGMPCKSSCVTVSTTLIVPGSKGGIASKGPASRLPGPAVAAEEEATTTLNWPVHDVRFSLRRALSDSSIKTDRQGGRRVPARWNLFPVC